MTLEPKTPGEIYQRVNDELARIVAELDTPSSDATLNQAQSEARELLIQYQTELRAQLAELEKHAEWNTFTIAFYGETGAGKSTVIETLRILLQERSKLANQQVFRELRKRYGQSEKKLQQVQHVIGQIDARLDELAQQLSVILQRYEQPLQAAQTAIDQADHQHAEQIQHLIAEHQQHERQFHSAQALVTQLQTLIVERKRTASLWQKLLNLLRRTPEEIELGQAQGKLITAIATRDAASAVLNSEQTPARQNRLALEGQLHALVRDRDNACEQLHEQLTEGERNKHSLIQQHQDITSQLTALLTELEQYADGEIIGDGRPDFTRETHRYNFELEGQPFALLDVPGIEGKEGLVLSQIEQAVQTAHAVFYVTNRPTPPQTGDEQHKGTLEKIKEHLGTQTEVWTLFNKKITNPKYLLAGRSLISDDENAGLADLNEKMREQLGEHYRETFPLTALPAFLASTDYFAPGSQNAKRRRKILENGSAEELLEKSRLREFLQLLGGQLIRDSKAKITRANFNKAKEALDQASAMLTGQQQNFAELAEKLEQDGESAKIQLNSSFKALKQRLESSGETLIAHFESDVRNKMYQTIDNDISNDTFKRELQNTINFEQERLIQKFPNAMKKEIEHFQRDAEGILKRFEEQARELSDIYAKINSTQLNGKFNLRLKLDNGIKIGALLLTLGGSVAAIIGTGGWVLAVGLATLAFAFAKSVWGFFSSDYKKSEQRKSTDSNLRKITEQLRDSLRGSLESALPEMQQKVSLLEQALATPARQTSALVQSLARSNAQLRTLSQQIAHTGNR